MTEIQDLVLLTAAYPFGNRNETFLETEIAVLAERFHKVYVLPSCKLAGQRPTPPNVELVEMHWLQEAAALVRHRALRALLSPTAARVIRWTVEAHADPRPYVRSLEYPYRLAREILKYRELVKFIRERELTNAIFCDYWFENSTVALAVLRERGLISTAVARAHGFDVYDERWETGAVPFRDAKARGLDAIFPVSSAGSDYLRARLPRARHKIAVQRLGVHIPPRISPPKTCCTPLILTCAAIEPIKCIHLVPEVLSRMKGPVHWVHYGEGPDRNRVIDTASRLLGDEVTWELRGHVDNRKVIEFYERNHVDALLSLSISEGLPVSMMEAQSHGVPIVARAVGGVPEIVTSDTGVLLAPDATPSQAALGLLEALQAGRFDGESVRQSCERRFDANANYNHFVDTLLVLHARQSGRLQGSPSPPEKAIHTP